MQGISVNRPHFGVSAPVDWPTSWVSGSTRVRTYGSAVHTVF